NLVNAIAESPVSGSMSSQLGAVGDLGRLGGGQKERLLRLKRILESKAVAPVQQRAKIELL
ncbi:hypothetical protein ACSETZ_28860, partial [Pseudomonas aeruginosa]